MKIVEIVYIYIACFKYVELYIYTQTHISYVCRHKRDKDIFTHVFNLV